MRYSASLLPQPSVVGGEVGATGSRPLTTIPEATWRAASEDHGNRIFELLSPGFVASAGSRSRRKMSASADAWRALDGKHPVYNFLVEYYAIKGAKSTRRFARWSPPLMPGGSAVLLEGAGSEEIETGCLLRRGAAIDPGGRGVIYDARAFGHAATSEQCASYLWYRGILSETARPDRTPVLHCYGLHEWAMQYWPEGSPPPPSAKYQGHLSLRASRAVINAAVERRGISCTHVDALRYFAPAAAPLNKHGATLQRTQQPVLEQPACVHASMDLLKMALKIQPWLPDGLLAETLETALKARTVDVAASPYDVSTTYGIDPIKVETEEGRADYRERQVELMEHARPVRQRLLCAYDAFLQEAFAEHTRNEASASPNPHVHYASATPGGPAWRWSN